VEAWEIRLRKFIFGYCCGAALLVLTVGALMSLFMGNKKNLTYRS